MGCGGRSAHHATRRSHHQRYDRASSPGCFELRCLARQFYEFGMNFLESVRVAARALRVNKMRSLLTVLGIVV